MASEPADIDAADAASAEPASSCRPGNQKDRSPPPGCPPHIQEPSPSSSAPEPLPDGSSVQRRTSFPISFPPIFFQRSKVPSASLAASTAEGKPVPVTDPTDIHRTSALQKLNSKYPSAARRHGYTPEAPSAQSSTYSQPVLVRTYSGPSPSQGSRSSRPRQYRPPSNGRGVSRRIPLPSASTPGSSVPGQPIQPTVSGVGVGTTSRMNTDRPSLDNSDTNAYEVNMPRPYKPKKAITGSSKLPVPWPWQSPRQEPQEPKLPPLEAFSFKSFMADLQAPGGDNDISADLDRIAEICARSRYSLSDQYEVHVAPHGSGASFMSGAGALPSSAPRRKGHSRSRSHGHGSGGPTLQAITSDDETSARSHPRRRNGNWQRRTAAYGTLETIMSSSRSSEEDKSKKKSAAELAGEVRGRAARKAWDDPSTSASGSASASAGNSNAATSRTADAQADTNTANPDDNTNAKLARKKSASFATAILDTNSSRSSGKKTSSNSTDASSSRRNHNNSRHRTATGGSASGLLSEPARPQTSGSHLGVRTAAPALDRGGDSMSGSGTGAAGGSAVGDGGEYGGDSTGFDAHAQAGGLPRRQDAVPPSSLSRTSESGNGSSSWGGWIPWRAGGAQAQTQGHGHGGGETRVSHAEGSLRLLLRGAGGGEGQVGRGVGR